MRVDIHVRPRATRTAVGGTHDGALVVRVAEPPHDSQATTAALRAVAAALGIAPRSVRLVHGATARRKLLDIAVSRGTVGHLERRLAQLRAG